MDKSPPLTHSRRVKSIAVTIVLLIASGFVPPEGAERNRLAVIGYWYGDATDVESHPINELTQIDFSFLHLKGNVLSVRNAGDSASIRRLVSLKERNPDLKVMLSLGGWGGCKTCSDVFSSEEGRREFAESTRELLGSFRADGIDLDWEYPAVEGYPGHRYREDDRRNFTLLVEQLRRSLGPDHLITFAAGGFSKYFREAVEWDQVMPRVDMVNLMTYDFVNAASTFTGHLTPLYSTAEQQESTDYAVRYLDSIGVPRRKMAIGLAFYARIWANVPATNNGLCQPGKFEAYIPRRNFAAYLTRNDGFQFFWDSVAHAPYAYNGRRSLYATYDDERSVAEKTRYAIDQGLGGVMFWDLPGDSPRNELLEAIARVRTERR